MKTINKIFIFVYYICVIIITLALISFASDIVIRRLVIANTDTETNTKSKYFYTELVFVWIGLIFASIWARHHINTWSKNTITTLVEKNGETSPRNELYAEVDHLVRINIIIIVGFLIVLFGSSTHSFREKMMLMNEDFGLFAETFI